MQNYTQIDTENFPIITVTYSDRTPTEAEFDAYLQDILDKVYNAFATDFVIIFDARDAKPYLASKLRIKQGNWITEHTEIIQKHCKSWVFVQPNTILQYTLKAIFAISPPPVSYKIYRDIKEAEDYAKALFSS
ncbi:MAG: hypothetical protein JJT94_08620 [Bernardetiaceae bacterium]|nr:hypothetical protein [Bernardetiaceae bacterium]